MTVVHRVIHQSQRHAQSIHISCTFHAHYIFSVYLIRFPYGYLYDFCIGLYQIHIACCPISFWYGVICFPYLTWEYMLFDMVVYRLCIGLLPTRQVGV